MKKAYLLYWADSSCNGDREHWSVFYTKCKAYNTAASRDRNMKRLEKFLGDGVEVYDLDIPIMN